MGTQSNNNNNNARDLPPVRSTVSIALSFTPTVAPHLPARESITEMDNKIKQHIQNSNPPQEKSDETLKEHQGDSDILPSKSGKPKKSVGFKPGFLSGPTAEKPPTKNLIEEIESKPIINEEPQTDINQQLIAEEKIGKNEENKMINKSLNDDTQLTLSEDGIYSLLCKKLLIDL